jgi:hypothetical protein
MDKQSTMISFRTEVAMPKVSVQLSYRRNFLMVGSCFTENIGNCLQNLCFPILTNPCGILYNPASMAGCLDLLVSEKQVVDSDLFHANGLWNNFSFHSRFSHPDKEKALTRMKNSLSLATAQLKTASHLFLTFGTSWAYRENEQGNIVGNCHKLPGNRFMRERLSVEQMTAQWVALLDRLINMNPELVIVLTVSPIRHLKDGSYENQVSKAGLFLLVDNLISQYGSGRIIYFPSYELIMDELRDYRFYAADMLHLSETATAYVQEKFNGVFINKESKEIILKVDKIVKSLAHKPFLVENSANNDLLSRLNEEAIQLATDHPYVNFQNLIIEIIQKKSL